MGAQMVMQQPNSLAAIAAALQEQRLLLDTLKWIKPFVGWRADMATQKRLEMELGIQVSLQDYSQEDLESAIQLVEGDIADMQNFHQLIIDRAADEKATYLLQVSSYPVFHIDQEDQFRESYMMSDGHEIQILDLATGEYRKLKYRVSDAAIFYPGVAII